jgi:hypothetical protein
LHPVPWQQLATRGVPSPRHIATAKSCFVDFDVQIFHQNLHRGGIGYKICGTGIEFGFQDGHGGFALLGLITLVDVYVNVN